MMSPLVRTSLAFLTAGFRYRASLQMENTMLRHLLNYVSTPSAPA